MKYIFFIALVLSSGSLWPQEGSAPLIYNRIQEKEMKQRAERLRDNPVQPRANGMELPFVDDFSTDKFPGNTDGEPEHWLDLSAFRNYTNAINPPSLGVVTFDGADEYGYPYDFNANINGVPCDTLTSVPINLNYPASDNIYFSFFYQGKGLREKPEPQDSLTLEFYAPNLDQWFHVWSVPGSEMTEFEKVIFQITHEKYLRDDFQFRFVNYATPRGALDHWHIDYVQLDRNRSIDEDIDDVAYRYPVRTILQDYSSMPWKHFIQNPGNYMADEVQLTAFNNNIAFPENNDLGNRTIFDRTVEVYYDGVLQGQTINESSPPITAQNELILTEPINSGSFNYVFDTDVNDTCAVFDVYFSNEVTPDIHPQNNVVHLKQEFYSYYAYDDGSPELVYYTELTGSRAALRYNNMMGDSLIGLAIWFEAMNTEPAGGNDSYFPMVWAVNNIGEPGNTIAQGEWSSVDFTAGQENGWRLSKFIDPVYIPSGGFFVGVTQTTDDYLNIGLDLNSNLNDGRLYWYDPVYGIWTENTSAANASLMIRPVFKSTKLGPLSVENSSLENAGIFPNPVTDEMTIRPGTESFFGVAEVLDLSGKVIRKIPVNGSTTWSAGDLASGMYLMRIQSSVNSDQRVLKFVKQ